MRLLRFLLLCLWLGAGPASADALAEVQRLRNAGQGSEAVELARRHITSHPKDAAMRFQLGVMLADGGEAAEARRIFEQLVQDYPELPEPYNNLAALKAAAGDIEGARASLDQALRANPALPTAHENMGDVQIMLALRSYARAQQLDPASTSVQAKLAMVRQLLQSVPGAGR